MTQDAAERIYEKLEAIHQELHQQAVLVRHQGERLTRLENEVWGNSHSGLAVKVRAVLWLTTGIATMTAMVLAQIVVNWLR